MDLSECQYCQKPISGRSDKKYCDQYCKSAFQYQKIKKEDQLYLTIDRQLKLNRKILKSYNKLGKTMIRKKALIDAGFNPKYFTHFWKNSQGQVYLFCYEYGFLSVQDNNKSKYLLVQYQNYMK